MNKEKISEEIYHRLIAWIERNDNGNGYVTAIGLRRFLTKLKK